MIQSRDQLWSCILAYNTASNNLHKSRILQALLIEVEELSYEEVKHSYDFAHIALSEAINAIYDQLEALVREKQNRWPQ